MMAVESLDPAMLSAWAELLKAVAWPGVVFIIALVFRRHILDLLHRDEVEIAGPGFNVSAKNLSVAAGAVLAASQDKDGAVSPSQIEGGVEAAAQDISALGRPPRVLWVDDRPSNNRLEAAALRALGMHVAMSVSTEDALERLAHRHDYDVVITDMGRPPDMQAGYTLLEAMRAQGDQTPVVIYASSNAPEHYDEAIRRGAIGSTSRPSQLLELVSEALQASRPGAAHRSGTDESRRRTGPRSRWARSDSHHHDPESA